LAFIGLAAGDAAIAQQAPFDNIEQSEPVPEPDNETTALSRSLTGATLQPGESAPCGPIGGTIWFQFNVTRQASIEIDAAGTTFPVILAAYTLTGFLPSPPGGSLANVACDISSETEPARLTFTALPGERYYIQAGGVEDAKGDVQLTFGCDPGCPPPNDNVLNAEFVFPQPAFTDIVSTQRATLEAGEAQPCGNIGATVWYAVSLPGAGVTGTLRVSAEGSDNLDTVAAIYAQRDFIPSPPGGIEPVACNDDNAGDIEALVEVPIERGVAYYVQVGGKDGAGGRITVNIFCGGCPIAIEGPETNGRGGQGGGGIEQPFRPVEPPNTGSGGYR
jgi:hypothetical protein